MRIPFHAIVLALALSTLAGCQREGPGSPAGDDARPAAQVAATDDDATARYACDAGATVVVLRDGNARAALPGGERYDLSRVAGSEPAVYAGSSLYFTLGTGSAHLSQQDGSRELACKLRGGDAAN
ncbi:MAG TPA: hypothetical protein VM619_04990 [Luteimonas sp.]|nr:hypothetical protein [Luteimonas sp.]